MKGYNARRKMFDPRSSIDQELKQIRRGVNHKANFYRAVVVDVLNDVNLYSAEELQVIQQEVENPGVLVSAPRNSIVARVVTNAKDRRMSSSIVLYPFLPPHLSLPVKSGEHVWIIFENEFTSRRIGYWMWRISEPEFVDDVNYTHADRKFNSLGFKTSREKANSQQQDSAPSFPNGAETSSTFTLKGENDYETIVKNSNSNLDFTPEPVPRFHKRAGDTVLQGSNNTLIVLGEDRIGPVRKTSEEQEKDQAGTIDIVAGRGRFRPEPGEPPELTAAPIVRNSRQNLETDKNIAKSGGTANPLEGDPDYINDSSRLLVSMRTNGDRNLGLEDQYPEPFETESSIVDDSAYAILKSDEIRIVARKDSDNDINGSVRILKEGDVDGDQAALLMLPDGTVRIDGSVIYIGRPGGGGPGPKGAEPFIKFSEYKSQVEELIGIVNDLVSTLTTNLPTIATAADAPPGGAPPAVTAAAAATVDFSKASVDLASLKSKIDNAKSKVIFGE